MFASTAKSMVSGVNLFGAVKKLSTSGISMRNMMWYRGKKPAENQNEWEKDEEKIEEKKDGDLPSIMKDRKKAKHITLEFDE